MLYYFFESFSCIIDLYFVPWPMIDNPTNYDKIMYSTLMCFHLAIVHKNSSIIMVFFNGEGHYFEGITH
jgi:hypothetical protein